MTSPAPQPETAGPPKRKRSLRRKLLFSCIPAFCVYLIAEAVATTLYVRGTIQPRAVWMVEDPGLGSVLQFDPIRGTRIMPVTARFACIATNGAVGGLGILRGNNEGFPDRDDHAPQRRQRDARRFAVFGDSYTAAQYLTRNWPDTAEDLARKAGAPVELLNFSIDGGGLVNWWSVLKRHVAEQKYDIDGVIIIAAVNDLHRPFIMWDDRFDLVPREPGAIRGIASGVCEDPDALPRTKDEAWEMIGENTYFQLLQPEEFERIVRGEAKPRIDRAVRPYFATKLFESLGLVSPDKLWAAGAPPQGLSELPPKHARLAGEIGEICAKHGWPCLVVNVFGESVDEAESFAKAAGARFVDAMPDLEPHMDDPLFFLPYDGHWSQLGSDFFARWMVSILKEWPEKK